MTTSDVVVTCSALIGKNSVMPVGLLALFLALGLFLWVLATLLPSPSAPRVALIGAAVCFLVDVVLAILALAS